MTPARLAELEGVDTGREAVEALAAERDERMAESLMMEMAHRDGGHHQVAEGWRIAAEQAQTVARTLRALLAERDQSLAEARKVPGLVGAEADRDRLRGMLSALCFIIEQEAGLPWAVTNGAAMARRALTPTRTEGGDEHG